MGSVKLAFVALLFAAFAVHAQDVVTVSLVARDGKFDPATIEVPAGKRIKVEVSNEGKTPIEFESKALKIEKVLAPGAKSSVVIPGEVNKRYFRPAAEDHAAGTIKDQFFRVQLSETSLIRNRWAGR